MPPRGIARARFLWLGHELLSVCVDVGIEPPDRLAQLLRIVDTRTDTTPESFCGCKHFWKHHLVPLMPLALDPQFLLGFQPHMTESFRILK